MYTEDGLKNLRDRTAKWRESQDPATQRRPEFHTPSQITVDQVYTPKTRRAATFRTAAGFPGEYPYLRGIHPSGYRDAFGPCACLRLRPARGDQRAVQVPAGRRPDRLSVAFDMPTLYGTIPTTPGLPANSAPAAVAVSSLADMEVLFDGIRLDQVTTSMTINSPAAIIWPCTWPWPKSRGPPSNTSAAPYRTTF